MFHASVVEERKIAMSDKILTKEPRHPMQPLISDYQGVIRFKTNKIVEFLLGAGPFDMNQLACMNFSDEDREQFAQLIGYSISGFGELPYVSLKTYNKAKKMRVR